MSEKQERPAQALHWVADGTTRLLAGLTSLADDDLDAPSLLPGWNRRYLLSHVANNASALRNLVHWARTGEERRMYASPEQRAADIEAGAAADAGELRILVASSAQGLWGDLDQMPEEAWSAEVITAQGLTRHAAEIPWMRAREVYVHAVDLDAGITFASLPAEFLMALADDIAGRRTSVAKGPALTVTAADAEATWTIPGSGDGVEVEGPLAAVTEWLAGRPVHGLATAAGGPLPELPPWL